MESFGWLLTGLGAAFAPTYLLYCFFGVVLGTLIGVLPGIGPVGGIALLLPYMVRIDGTAALIFMAAVYYGTMYGGSTTSILLNVPGEVASVVTAIDGYRMAQQGRAPAALAVSAIGSFVAGTFGVIALMTLAPALVPFALAFGPPEYFALMVFGLMLVTRLSAASTAKSLTTILLGVFVALVGMDPISGRLRFTHGIPELWKGINIVPLAMGLFGVAEILVSVEQLESVQPIRTRFWVWLSREERKQSSGPIARGSILGFFVGLLPGGGAVLASYLSYVLERWWSRSPERFGDGAIEGVAGPESANNSATAGAMVPLLTLGLPTNPVTALMFGILVIHGLQPGPRLLEQQPQFFWTFIASMYLGNVMLLVLNLPLVGVWAAVLRVRMSVLAPIIMLIMFVGAYSVDNSMFDVAMLSLFGIVGYVLRKASYPLAPMVLAFILGSQIDSYLRQSLVMSGGDLTILLLRPVASVFLAGSAAVLLLPGLIRLWRYLVGSRPPAALRGSSPGDEG